MAASVQCNEVVIRYFTTITPKEEGSVIIWRDAPHRFNGVHILEAMKRKGVPLTQHLPQVYDERVQGYCNLDPDIEMEMPKDGRLCRIDVRLTPLTPPNPTAEPSSAAKHARSAPVMANPGPMALFAFGFTTLMLMLIECKIVEGSAIVMVIGYAMFHGGLVQLVVGFIEIYRNNLFGATAFASYGAFWMGWGLTQILAATGLITTEPFPEAKAGYLAMWGIFTTLLFVQTLFINYCLQAIFFLLALTFYLLAAGVFYSSVQVAGGISGIILAIVVAYTASAELYNDFGNIRLPLFHVSAAKEEFGNAHPGRGEILTAADPAGLVPLRRRSFSPGQGVSAFLPGGSQSNNASKTTNSRPSDVVNEV